MLQVIEERERLQAEFKKKSELEKEELKSNWIEKIDNTDQVRGRLCKNIYVELFSELLSGRSWDIPYGHAWKSSRVPLQSVFIARFITGVKKK